jgi:DNA-binding transcriptional regulator/RsmH inhibitor MraZ
MGEARVVCDERGRIVLPSDYAAAFEGAAEVVIGPAPGGESLYVFPAVAWTRLVRRLRKAKADGDAEAGPFLRLYTSLYRRERVQGAARRVALTRDLMELAGLSEGVVLVGRDDRLEVLSESRWQERFAGILSETRPLAAKSRWD